MGVAATTISKIVIEDNDYCGNPIWLLGLSFQKSITIQTLSPLNRVIQYSHI